MQENLLAFTVSSEENCHLVYTGLEGGQSVGWGHLFLPGNTIIIFNLLGGDKGRNKRPGMVFLNFIF